MGCPFVVLPAVKVTLPPHAISGRNLYMGLAGRNLYDKRPTSTSLWQNRICIAAAREPLCTLIEKTNVWRKDHTNKSQYISEKNVV